jgi:glycosyltransferase involved in cell wall biosynthesis
MRFLIVTAVFPPEPGVTGQTSAHIAEGLVRRGHQVSVISPFPNRPGGRLYQGFRRAAWQRERRPEGFELIRCFSFFSRKSTLVSRFFENVSFGMTAGLAALTSRRPDVIYSNTWPLFASGLIYLVSRLRGIPMVVSIQDAYPECMAVQGRFRPNGLAVRLLRALDGFIASGCAAVIVAAESFVTLYRQTRAVAPERLLSVPNWGEDTNPVPDCERAGVRKDLGIPDDAFLLVYGGNIGRAAGVETVVEAAMQVRDDPRVRVLIAGEGSSLGACRKRARESGCRRILFLVPWPRERTGAVLSAADVLILPTRGDQSLASMPSKLVAYMLAGRPILALALAGSDLARTICRAGCGWVIPPDRPDLLASQIRETSRCSREELATLGLAGRSFAAQHLTRTVCLPNVIRILESAKIGDVPLAHQATKAVGSYRLAGSRLDASIRNRRARKPSA